MHLFLTSNHDLLPLLVAIIGGYLSGSVPYGLILTRMAGIADIRKSGSGNIGATNVLRTAGKRLAVLTLVLDALKGLVPVLVAAKVHLDYAILAGVFAFLGHVFPVWLKFKGGKGVATAFGVCFGFSWMLGGIMAGVWMLVAGITQYSSVAGLTVFGIAPLVAFRITGSLPVTLAIFVITVVIWIRHAANIKRLISDTESKIEFSKSEKKDGEEKPASGGSGEKK